MALGSKREHIKEHKPLPLSLPLLMGGCHTPPLTPFEQKGDIGV